MNSLEKEKVPHLRKVLRKLVRLAQSGKESGKCHWNGNPPDGWPSGKLDLIIIIIALQEHLGSNWQDLTLVRNWCYEHRVGRINAVGMAHLQKVGRWELGLEIPTTSPKWT